MMEAADWKGEAMSRRLISIQDWDERALGAGYSVKQLARLCAVSERTLRRFLCQQFGICPHEWLRKLRMRRAVVLLAEGARVKDVAEELGYAEPWQFSRSFKGYHGYSPSCHGKKGGEGEVQ